MNPVKDGDAEAEEDEEALNSLSDEDKLARSHFNHQVLLRAVPAVPAVLSSPCCAPAPPTTISESPWPRTCLVFM